MLLSLGRLRAVLRWALAARLATWVVAAIAGVAAMLITDEALSSTHHAVRDRPRPRSARRWRWWRWSPSCPVGRRASSLAARDRAAAPAHRSPPAAALLDRCLRDLAGLIATAALLTALEPLRRRLSKTHGRTVALALALAYSPRSWWSIPSTKRSPVGARWRGSTDAGNRGSVARCARSPTSTAMASLPWPGAATATTTRHAKSRRPRSRRHRRQLQRHHQAGPLHR